MKQQSHALMFALAWLPTALTTPVPALIFWYAFRPAVGPPPTFSDVTIMVAVVSIGFAIPAALVGALLWPVTRRVLKWTRKGSLWRLLYGAAAGAATGVAFIAFVGASVLPATINWLGAWVAIPPAAATGLLWAIWFAALQRWLGTSRPPAV